MQAELLYNEVLQLLKIIKKIFLGDILLEDIYLDENLWIQVIPKLDDNLNEILHKIDQLSEPKIDANFYKSNCVCSNCLKSITKKWCNGQISNFDYLTVLNVLAGRRKGEPGNHHVMPWVTDFSSKSGSNWRDLTKSKYRLNKGNLLINFN